MLVGPGDAVDVRFTKWGGGRHWEFPVTAAGRRPPRCWCGAPAGTQPRRVGAAFTSQFGWVTLFPVGQPWAASYYDSPDQPIAVYVDVTTPPVWNGSTVTMVDLDLDVIAPATATCCSTTRTSSTSTGCRSATPTTSWRWPGDCGR